MKPGAYGHNQNIYNKHTLHWQTRAECMCRQTNIVLLLLWLKIGNHIILGRRMVEMWKASMDSLWQKRLQNCSFQWVHWECLFVHKCDHHLGLSKGQIRTLEQSISFVMNLHSYFSIPDKQNGWWVVKFYLNKNTETIWIILKINYPPIVSEKFRLWSVTYHWQIWLFGYIQFVNF